MTKRMEHPRQPRELEVEIPLQFDEGEDNRWFWVRARVKLGPRRAWVTSPITVIDQRTLEVEDLEDDVALEHAELALIEAAKDLARVTWTAAS